MIWALLSHAITDTWVARQVATRTTATASSLLSSRTRSDSFYLLDGLRGVAAVAVLMVHAAVLFRPVWMRSGYLAVDLFFALSGFVLTHAYGPRLMAGMTALAFVRLRLIRILPLYLLGTTIAVASALEQCVIGNGEWQMRALVRCIVAGAFLVPLPPVAGAPNGFAFPLNIPAWSLFFELLVNVFYATAFRFLTPWRTVVLVGIALGGLAGTAWYFDGLNAGADWPKLWGGVPRVVFSFFTGVVLYRVVGTVRRPRRGPRRGPRRVGPWIILPALFVLFALPVPAAFRWAFDLVCVVVLFPLLIWYAATAESGRGAPECGADPARTDLVRALRNSCALNGRGGRSAVHRGTPAGLVFPADRADVSGPRDRLQPCCRCVVRYARAPVDHPNAAERPAAFTGRGAMNAAAMSGKCAAPVVSTVRRSANAGAGSMCDTNRPNR